MRKPQRTPDPAAVARSLRELKTLFRPPDPKQKATRQGGLKSESLAKENQTCGNDTPPTKNFNAESFLTASAGDVALLHLALVNLANNHALTTPAVIHMAGRNIALAYLAAGGAL